jgi:hypothetical protein
VIGNSLMSDLLKTNVNMDFLMKNIRNFPTKYSNFDKVYMNCAPQTNFASYNVKTFEITMSSTCNVIETAQNSQLFTFNMDLSAFFSIDYHEKVGSKSYVNIYLDNYSVTKITSTLPDALSNFRFLLLLKQSIMNFPSFPLFQVFLDPPNSNAQFVMSLALEDIIAIGFSFPIPH